MDGADNNTPDVLANPAGPTPSAASPVAVTPEQPHARLLSMMQGLALGAGAFAHAAATGGREGGVQEVQEAQMRDKEMKMRQQAAQQQAQEHDLRMKTGIADFNMKQAQLASFIHDMPLNHQKLSDDVQSSMIDLLQKKGVPLAKAVAHVEGQTTDQHIAAVNTATNGDFTSNFVIPTYGEKGVGGGSGNTYVVSNQSVMGMTLNKDDIGASLGAMSRVVDEAKTILGEKDPSVQKAAGQLALVNQGLSGGGSIGMPDWLRLSGTINTELHAAMSQKKEVLDFQTKSADLKEKQQQIDAASRPKNADDAQARLTQAQQTFRANPTPETKQAMTNAQEQLQGLKRLEISRTYAEAAARVQAQRNVEDKDIALVAQELVKPDNLTSLKDIASVKGSERLRIYAAAKAIDPSFDPSIINNKIRFLNEFTNPNGKTSLGIDSANTFMQHGGDLLDITAQYRNTSLKALNAPLNALRDAAGDASYSRYKAALDVVRTEYINAVKAGFAPQQEDSKEGRDIMSESSSPAQVEAATKQMGHTITRRMDSTNEKFKTVMGQNYPNLLTPAAQQGAAKLGLTEAVSKFSSGGTIGKAGKQPVYRGDKIIGYTTDGKTMTPVQ